MANEAPSMTKATYDKKRTRRPAPSPEARQAQLDDTARDAAEARRFNRLLHQDKSAALRELGFDVQPPEKLLRRI